jgi:hypothetical protein
MSAGHHVKETTQEQVPLCVRRRGIKQMAKQSRMKNRFLALDVEGAEDVEPWGLPRILAANLLQESAHRIVRRLKEAPDSLQATCAGALGELAITSKEIAHGRSRNHFLLPKKLTGSRGRAASARDNHHFGWF